MTRAVVRSLLTALLMAVSTPLAAQNSVQAQAAVKVVKPVTLTANRNLLFGDILVGSLTANDSVSVAVAGRTCGTSGRLTCSGTFSTAEYTVTGTNGQVVLISTPTPTVVMTGSNGGTITVTPSFIPTVTLPNSGNKGVTFEVGGTITITPTTREGTYTGTLDIQVAYQ